MNTDQPNEPSGTLGGASRLPDAARWRAIAAGAAHDLPTMQRVAVELRSSFSSSDLGSTTRALAALAEGSHVLARLVQVDLQAARTLRAAGVPVPADLLVQLPVEKGAVRATAGPDGDWRLDGSQRRSIHLEAAGRALVVATTCEGDRLFVFRPDAPGVARERRPLSPIAPSDPSGPSILSGVAASPVGTAAWWAGRKESFDDLLCDVACWFGAAVWLCRAVESTLGSPLDAADLLRAGRVDVWVYSARLAIRDALPVVEADPTGRAAEIAARRAAAVVVTTTETVIRLVALLSDPRATNDAVSLPSRVGQLQIALRRFDPAGNLRALALAIAADRTDRGASD